MPLIGRDPAGFRPPRWAKVAMVASGLPAYVARSACSMSGRDETAAWVLGVGGVVLTLAGLVAARSLREPAGVPARASPGASGGRWR